MVAVKVWLGGESSAEIGTRDAPCDRDTELGVLEALLLRVEPVGWNVVGATRWRSLRKYRVGAALDNPRGHADAANALTLVFRAHEEGADVVAFSRDHDGDDDREVAVERGIELARVEGWPILIIGGVAKPAIEGWVLALASVAGTDDLTRNGAEREAAAISIPWKEGPAAYVAIVEAAWPGRQLLDVLPTGCDSLRGWLDQAATVLAAAIRGE